MFSIGDKVITDTGCRGVVIYRYMDNHNLYKIYCYTGPNLRSSKIVSGESLKRIQYVKPKRPLISYWK